MGLAPIVNTEVASASSREARHSITRRYLHRTLLLTLPLALLAGLIPESMYTWVFGIEGISLPLRILIPGMLAGATSSILAHHLSAIGLHKWNAITSGIGLLVLVYIGWYEDVVPLYGVPGAAFAASCAYLAQTSGLAIAFLKADRKES